jgi:hypothetical protein
MSQLGQSLRIDHRLVRSSPVSRRDQSPSACLKDARSDIKKHTPLALAAGASELSFTVLREFLETVKHSPALWTLKVPIGTAVAIRLLDVTSNGSRIESAYPDDQRDYGGS